MPKSYQIVTRVLCGLNANMETLVDGELNHFDICKLRIGSAAYLAAAALFTNVVENAPKAIAETFRPCKSEV